MHQSHYLQNDVLVSDSPVSIHGTSSDHLKNCC